uniref:Poly [ADP-ribose] polymerase n=1 Tax=Percolomonas cosmopolitus TaxID=63605 RepID=A0A7S1PKE8_9EUKA
MTRKPRTKVPSLNQSVQNLVSTQHAPDSSTQPSSPQLVLRILGLPNINYDHDCEEILYDLKQELMDLCPSLRSDSFSCELEPTSSKIRPVWVNALVFFQKMEDGSNVYGAAVSGRLYVCRCKVGVEFSLPSPPPPPPPVLQSALTEVQDMGEMASSPPVAAHSGVVKPEGSKQNPPTGIPTFRFIILPAHHPHYFSQLLKVKTEIQDKFNVKISHVKRNNTQLKIDAPSKKSFKLAYGHIENRSKELKTLLWDENVLEGRMRNHCVTEGIWVHSIYLSRVSQKEVFVIPSAKYKQFIDKYHLRLVEVYYPLKRFMQQEMLRQRKKKLKHIQQQHSLKPFVQFSKLNGKGFKISGTKKKITAAFHDLDELTSNLLRSQVIRTLDVETSTTQKIIDHISGPNCSTFLAKLPSTHIIYPNKKLQPKTTLKRKLALVEHDKVIEIREGSILNVQADAYVNSANIEFHNAGGIAKIIEDASSPKMRDEIKTIKTYRGGDLVIGSAVVTMSAPYAALYVIHAFPPPKVNPKSTQLMKQCVKATFNQAARLKLESIAIPLLGAGIFGWSARDAAEVILPVVIKILKRSDCVTKKVIFVDTNSDCVAHIEGALNQAVDPSSMTTISPDVQQHSSSIVTQWYWRNPNDQWEGYPQEICRKISVAIKSNSGFLFKQNGREYIVDPAKKIQVNQRTRTERCITNKISEGVVNQWSWRDGDQGWKKYSANDNMKICTAHANGESQVTLSNIFRHVDDAQCDYIVDLKRMCQINTNTSYERKIQVNVLKQAPVVVKNRARPVLQTKDIHEDSLDNCIRFVCFSQADADKINDKLERVAKKFRFEKEIPYENFCDYVRMCRKYGIRFTRKQDKVLLTGDQMIVEIVADLLSKQQNDLPTHWEPMERDEYTKVVPASDDERQKVERDFLVTTPEATITSVERIQSVHLWKKYASHRQVLEQRRGKKMTELSLFHGTRSTQPSVIFESEKGFDRTHSRKDCLFGSGFYFAKNSRYSVSYASVTPDGKRQMFVARVLVGDFAEDVPQAQHTAPPAHKDSIKANLNGSDVYVVFHSESVYPEFLVTFSV